MNKTRSRIKAICFLLLLALLNHTLQAFGTEDDNYIQAPGIIGVNSNISAGREPITTIARRAKERNLKVIILTDQVLSRGEYGLWPLRKIIRKVVEKESILSFGAKRYLRLVNEINQADPDMVIIPGVDVAPFYYWSGKPFTNDFTVYDWSKQLLVIGLDKAHDLRDLPIVANKYRPLHYGMQSIPQLWPVLGLLLGVFLFRKRKFRYRDSQGRELGPVSPFSRGVGIVITILCVVVLINNFPFTVAPEFDPYHGYQGSDPYQRLIDYVNSKDGMVFWSVPEAKAIPAIIRGVSFLTTRGPSDLVSTLNYTGFGAIYGDVRMIHQPNCEWDRLLQEYCQGRRNKPVWAIGEADYHGSTEIDCIQTVFLVKELTQTEVLAALKHGRIYARAIHRNGEVNLDSFTVVDVQSGQKAYMGDELLTSGQVNIKIEGSYVGAEGTEVVIQLIKNGERFKLYTTKESKFTFEVADLASKIPEKNYYRLIISCSYGEIVSNPIFVKCRLP